MTTQPITSPSAFVGRIFWMIAGPLLLAVLAINIAQSATGWLTPSDLFYFLVLGGMLFGRWLEFHSGNAMTSTGEPATLEHLHRYLATTALLGMGLWVVVNLIGNR